MHDHNYPHVTHAFYNQPWAILPEKLAEMKAFVDAKMRGEAPPPMPAAAARSADYHVSGRTAIIPVMGVLAQRMGMMQAISGGTSTEAVGRQLDAAAADRSVRSIVLMIDSPGGSTFGIQELAAKILDARASKKVIAVADSVAASAAYWLASQATEVVATPGGMVGSVGVYLAHQDTSKAEEAMGVKTTIVKAGKYKAETDGPLTQDAQDYLQSMVDEMYGAFVKAIAKGRGVTEARVERDYGQGRVMLARAAKEAGMVDRIGTMAQVLERLGADAAASAATTMAIADVMADATRMVK